jgi:hypothetical protein
MAHFGRAGGDCFSRGRRGERVLREEVVKEAKPSTILLVLTQIIERIRKPKSPAKVQPIPKLRNFLIDILAEGRRKNIAHIVFDADISELKERLTEYRLATGESISITSVIAQSLARAVAADKRMQAYRFGRSQLVLFEDVDIAFMVEREWAGETLPVVYIMRATQQKSAQEIHYELQSAKVAPLGTRGPISALDLQIQHLPRVVRKIAWFFIRRNPYRFKNLAGTVGLTSFGMHTSGAALGLPITPMTLTLTVGGIEKKLTRRNGQFVERDIIHLGVSVDHEINDGAPAMRFIERFKTILQTGGTDLSASDSARTG